MVDLTLLAKRLDEPALARLGAALWSKIGSHIEPRDLSWASSLLGGEGKDLIWSLLVEQGVVDQIGMVSSKALAQMLKALCGEHEDYNGNPQVVWTLPEQHPDTPVLGSSYREAILATIDGAKRELIISSPYLEETGIHWLTEAILRALLRNVEVTVITYRAEDIASYQSKTLENLRREADLRGKRLSVYSVSEQSEFIIHAKIIVADSEAFVIGSANMTSQGLGGHLECGVAMKGSQSNVVRMVLLKSIESGMASLVFSTASRHT